MMMRISTPTPIKITAQNRRTPYLQEYLKYLLVRVDWKAKMIAGACVSGVGVAGLAGAGGLAAFDVLNPGLALWALVNAFGLMLVGGLGSLLWFGRHRPLESDETLVREAKGIGQKLNASLAQRRLYREMHPNALQLLEESARCWQRVHDTINGSFWSSADLPAHYQGVRAQAQASADRAMMEILLNLRSAVKPIGQPQTLVEGIQTMLDAVGINIGTQVNDEPLPEGFPAAAVLAKGLSELATEIEKTGIQAIKSASPTPIDSGENIRQTLEDLKQIRAAESELEDLRARN